MKTFWKTENRQIDNLLRARRGEESAAEALCREFDPDLANAYIERCLLPAEQARYERHISLCSSCRKSTVALARMAQAEAGSSVAISGAVSGNSGAGLLAPLKGFFIGLARPQVALAVVAVIALAVSLPLVLSRKDQTAMQMASEKPAPAPQEFSKATLVSPADQKFAQVPEPSNEQETKSTARIIEAGAAGAPVISRDESRQDAAEPGKEIAERQAPAMAADAAASGEVQKNEVKSEPVAAPEAGSQVAQATPKEPPKKDDAALNPPASRAQTEEQEKLARIEPEEALRLKKNKDSVSVTDLKPGRPDVVSKSRDRGAAIRPEHAVAPPSETTSDESGRRSGIASEQPGRAFREGKPRAATPKRGTPERRAGGKKFYLLGDVWTDKDYKPEKEMPVVTLVRDSDLYKEVLAKNNGLKIYFSRFVEKERVIIVYKDTVYKINPPEK
jgi:hypothetical protein